MTIYVLDTASVCIGPVELPVIPGLGKQMPSNAIELELELPLPEEGTVWVWREGAVENVPDHRGVVFSKETGAEQQWTKLGELPDEFTVKRWPGRHHIWLDNDWHLDMQAQEQALIERLLAERDGLLYEAGLRIAPLQDAVEMDKATADEKALLVKWKSYRVDLSRIEDQEGYPSDIDWPTQPQTRRAR